MSDLSIILGVGAVLVGAPMILNPAKARQSAEAKWKRRVAELEGGAEKNFFEEHRTLKAYPPLSSDEKKRALGVLLVLLGGAEILMNIFR